MYGVNVLALAYEISVREIRTLTDQSDSGRVNIVFSVSTLRLYGIVALI